MANYADYGHTCDDEDENDEHLENATGENKTDSFVASAPASPVKVTGLSLGNTLKSVSKSIDQSQSISNDVNETSVNTNDNNGNYTITASSDNDWGILGLLISILISIIFLI